MRHVASLAAAHKRSQEHFMDKISRKRRSENMSAIKSSGTKPELMVRAYLRNGGVQYRCNARGLPGRPDISIQKWKLALNIHGCFWHGHQNCKDFRLPKSNVAFWESKISKNIERDEANRQNLLALGFSYTEIWQCELERGEFQKLDQFISEYWRRRNDAQHLAN